MTSTPTSSAADVPDPAHPVDPVIDYESKKPKADRGIPSLDGIRAASIVIVAGSHAFTEKIPGGFGLSVFFFLSGYLITTLMRIEREKTGTLNLRKFYARRALRILPGAYLVLIVSFLLAWAGWIWAYDSQSGVEDVTWKAFGYHFFYLNNYYHTFFDNTDSPHGTGVYWSLAVEEHFYLIFPVAFLLLHRFLRTAWQRAGALLVVCGITLAWRIFIVKYFWHEPRWGMSVDDWQKLVHSYAYRSTDARLDSLAFGCILALVGNPYLDRKWLSDNFWCYVAVPIALICIGSTFLVRESSAGENGLLFREAIRYTIQSAALFPIFIAAVRCPDKWMFRWLNWPIVKFLGVLSYSLYLVHLIVVFNVQRLFWYTAYNHKEAKGAILTGSIAMAISLLLALAMYYGLERPVQALRRKLH